MKQDRVWIKGGYYVKARRIQESEIAHATPCIREVWDWLIMQCNHVPKKTCGTIIDRGQCLRSIRDIQDGLSWKSGYRKETYSKSQVEYALNWLRRGGYGLIAGDHTDTPMVTTRKTTRGMIITVCNYDYYQRPENYEHNNGQDNGATTVQQASDTINKNDKNVKNEKKEYIYVKIFDFYESVMGTVIKKTSARKNKIKLRLKTFTESEIIQAIENVSKSPFHMGENDRGVKYNSIDLIVRSDEQVEKYLNMKSVQQQTEDEKLAEWVKT